MFIKQRFLGPGVMLTSLLILSSSFAQKVDFEKRHKSLKERFEKNKGAIRNKAVHEPPLIKATESNLRDQEPVIGFALNKEARAYPLTMLFAGGGIFELLNDTCGGEPIAVSW